MDFGRSSSSDDEIYFHYAKYDESDIFDDVIQNDCLDMCYVEGICFKQQSHSFSANNAIYDLALNDVFYKQT